MTALDTTRIQIHGDDVDVHFETQPDTPNECVSNGAQLRLTGTITISYTPGPPKVFNFGGGFGKVVHLLGLGPSPPRCEAVVPLLVC